MIIKNIICQTYKETQSLVSQISSVHYSTDHDVGSTSPCCLVGYFAPSEKSEDGLSNLPKICGWILSYVIGL